jgi:hypothetical protein
MFCRHALLHKNDWCKNRIYIRNNCWHVFCCDSTWLHYLLQKNVIFSRFCSWKCSALPRNLLTDETSFRSQDRMHRREWATATRDVSFQTSSTVYYRGMRKEISCCQFLKQKCIRRACVMIFTCGKNAGTQKGWTMSGGRRENLRPCRVSTPDSQPVQTTA